MFQSRLLVAATFAAFGVAAFSLQPGLAATPDKQETGGTMKAPKRTVLFVIDGLHAQAPERLNLGNFTRLAAEGTWFRRAHLLLPYHPTTGDWAALHNSSLPNPIMLAGTLFIRPGQDLIQDCFYPSQLTAHVADSDAYASINRSNSFSCLTETTDEAVIEHALGLLRQHDIRFMRIHLQETGLSGWKCHSTTENVPWRRNIWADGSPYVAAAQNADRLLGRFLEQLGQMDKKDDTLLVVTADHGNAPTGAHPPTCEDSWITPLLFVGPGIAPDRVLDYAEHIDIVPTICHLMGLAPPNQDGGSGRVLRECLANEPQRSDASPQRLRELNLLLCRYAKAQARLRLGSEQNPALELEADIADNAFFGLHRVPEWPKAGSLDHLIAVNRTVLQSLENLARCAADRSDSARPIVALDRYYRRSAGYAWDDTSSGGYSDLQKLVESVGAQTTVITGPASQKTLAGVSVYMIVNPDTPKTPSDPCIDGRAIEEIAAWVQSGGTLVLLNNGKGVGEFVHMNELAERFGIRFNEDVRFGPGVDSKAVPMHTFPAHPFFAGVERLYMRSVCTLSVQQPAEAIFRFNGDAIMALSTHGKGVVFALGDPWGYNEYINHFNNRTGLANVFRWLLARPNAEQSAASCNVPPALARVLLIGDSISEGYTGPVRTMLAGKASIDRISVNGEHTFNGLKQLDQWLGDSHWDVICFNWGLHDVKIIDGRCLVPLAQYEQNLQRLVERLKKTKAKLIWCSTTPVPPIVQGGAIRRNDDVIAYNAVAKKIMEANAVPIDDLYAEALPQLEKTQKPRDVHFTPEGYEILGRHLAAAISSVLAQVTPETPKDAKRGPR